MLNRSRISVIVKSLQPSFPSSSCDKWQMMTGSEFLFFVNCNISILCGPLSSEAHTEDCAPKIKKQKLAFDIYLDIYTYTASIVI